MAGVDDLRQRSWALLEFPQVLEALASHTSLPSSREAALLLQPSYEMESVSYRQQETAEARAVLEEIGAPAILITRDVRPLLEQIDRGMDLTSEGLLLIADTLEILRQGKAIGKRLQARTPILRTLSRNIPDLKKVEQGIRRRVLASGDLDDNATAYLRQIREEIRTNYENSINHLEEIIKGDAGRDFLQEPIITVRADRLVLPVKMEVRRQFPGIVHDISESGATAFMEPFSAVAQINAWRQCLVRERAETRRILRRLTSMVGSRIADMRFGLEMMTRIDLAFAKARFGRSYQGVRPRLLDKGVGVINMRHPLLAGEVVPSSVIIAPPVTGVVITGPNTGGKTVSLKALGLAVLMNQSGLELPADGSTSLPVVDGVFADIGDQQSIERSISTFSSHISAISSFLRVVSDKSLVLIDELGTSTDPEEGAALANAILSRLAEMNVMTVVTTHHRAVSSFAESHPFLTNASVDLDPITLEPNYKLTMGLPGRSHAFTVAANLGLDPSIITVAEKMLDPVHQEGSALITSLREEMHLTRRKLEETEDEKKKISVLREEFEKQLEILGRTKENILEETRKWLQSEVKKIQEKLARAQVASSWEPTSGSVVPEWLILRKELEETQKELRSKTWARQLMNPGTISVPNIGEEVEIESLGMFGEVISEMGSDNKLELQIGNMRLRLEASKIKRVRQRINRPNRSDSGPIHLKIRPKSVPSDAELHLRGKGLQESLEELDRFLDNMLAFGGREARIVHGKGTGILRQGVWEHLAKHPEVVSYDFAPYHSGGNGVTIVELY